MANRWRNMETVTDFIFLRSKITAESDCSHKVKRCLLLRRKVMTNLNSIFKSRDITLPTKVHIVKALFFPVVMYGCERWIIKKAECKRIGAFKLWWWRLLRVSCTVRISNQSIVKEINPDVFWKDWCWSCSSNTLTTWCKEPTHWKRTWLWGRLSAGREGDNRGWDGWMASLIQWTHIWANSGREWRTGNLGMLQFMGSQMSRTWLSNWNTTTIYSSMCKLASGGLMYSTGSSAQCSMI